MDEVKACHRDIERALKNGYPSHLLHKLLDRKGKCLMKMQHYSDAIVVLGEAIALARKNVKDDGKISQFLTEAQKCLKMCSSKKSASLDRKVDFDQEESKLPMLTGVNPQMPAYSKAVLICHTPKVQSCSAKQSNFPLISIQF